MRLGGHAGSRVTYEITSPACFFLSTPPNRAQRSGPQGCFAILWRVYLLEMTQILRVEHSGWKGIPFQKSFHLHILTWDLWNVHVGLKRGVYNDLLCIRRAETSACFQTFTEAVPLGGSRKEPWHLEDRRQGCILPWKVLLQETSHGQQGGGKRCPCSRCHIGTAQRPSQHVYGVTRCVVLRIKEG